MRLGPAGFEPSGFSASFPDPLPLSTPGGIWNPLTAFAAITLSVVKLNGKSGVHHANVGEQPFHCSSHQRETQHSGRGSEGTVKAV